MLAEADYSFILSSFTSPIILSAGTSFRGSDPKITLFKGLLFEFYFNSRGTNIAVS